MKRLTVEDILLLHRMLIQETGGKDGLRDSGLLDMAANSPYQTFGGQELYPSLPEKAAQLCFSLIQDHPFLDGNKRIGVLAMLTLLELNSCLFLPTDQDLIRIGLGVASGELGTDDIRRWIVTQELS